MELYSNSFLQWHRRLPSPYDAVRRLLETFKLATARTSLKNGVYGRLAPRIHAKRIVLYGDVFNRHWSLVVARQKLHRQ